MSEAWLSYALLFACAVLAAQFLQLGLAGALRGRRRTARRFAALAPAAREEAGAVLRRRSGRRFALAARMETVIAQSGTRLTGPQAGLVLTVGTLGLFLLLPWPAQPPLRLLLAAATAMAGLWVHLRTRRARRLRRFGEQLPEVVDVIVRSLRAGHPLPVSLALVAREMPEPAGPEFALVVDEVSYGRSLPEALENLHARVGYPELRFLVTAVAIASQTGGNLGEVLSRLARTLRERFRLGRRVRALSAEGRFSGVALSALPVVLFGVINLVSASYYAELWASPAFPTIAGVAIGLLVVGNLAIYRLVHFKV